MSLNTYSLLVNKFIFLIFLDSTYISNIKWYLFSVSGLLHSV